jgi:hypothetical protein
LSSCEILSQKIESIYIPNDVKSGNSQKILFDFKSLKSFGPIETADRKLTDKKQKSLPLPFEMTGRRKTLLLCLNPIPL